MATKDQGTCVCMAVHMDARSRNLYLRAKSLVHHINRNKDRSHWLSALIFVNEGQVWCPYCDLMNTYTKLFKTRDLNPSRVDIEHMHVGSTSMNLIAAQIFNIDIKCEP